MSAALWDKELVLSRGVQVIDGIVQVGGGVGPEVGDDVLHASFEEDQKFALGVGALIVKSAKCSRIGMGDVL